MQEISKRIHNCCHEILSERQRLIDITMLERGVIEKMYKLDPAKKREEKQKANERYSTNLYQFIMNACRRYELRSEYVFKIIHPQGNNWLNSIRKSIDKSTRRKQ